MANLFGLNIPFTTRKPKPTETLGTAGVAVHGGFIETNERNAKLTGDVKYTTYSDILANITIVAASVRYFLNLVTKANWTVVPANDTPEAIRLAELTTQILGDMRTPWKRVVRRSAMYRFYGFSVQEWTAKKRDDGVIGFLDVAPRAQRTIYKWDVDETGQVLGCVQRAPQDQREIYLPRSKTIYMVDDSLNDSPEGLGLFRHTVEKSNVLALYEKLEGWGYEADMRGIPIGRAPIGKLRAALKANVITVDEFNLAVAPIKDIVANHIKGPARGLVIDSAVQRTDDEAARPSATPEWDLNLLEAGITGQEAINTAINRVNRELAIVLGTENLLTGADGVGSNALSKDKSDNFFTVVESSLGELRETFTKEYIDPLWELNGWPDELKPAFKTEAIQYRDILEVTGALRDLATAGAPMALDDPAVDEVRELVGLSPQPERDPLADPGLLLRGTQTDPDDPMEEDEEE